MVSFLKGLIGLKKEDPNEFFTKFTGEGRFYMYEKNQKKCM